MRPKRLSIRQSVVHKKDEKKDDAEYDSDNLLKKKKNKVDFSMGLKLMNTKD